MRTTPLLKDILIKALVKIFKFVFVQYDTLLDNLLRNKQQNYTKKTY